MIHTSKQITDTAISMLQTATSGEASVVIAAYRQDWLNNRINLPDAGRLLEAARNSALSPEDPNAKFVGMPEMELVV